MKSRSTAIIFAFLFGGLGAHRFYLNQIGLGILYLLFCWTFIPTIISCIDIIAFLVMSKETFNSRYNRVNVAAEELRKWHDLRQEGIITEKEYEQKRKFFV